MWKSIDALIDERTDILIAYYIIEALDSCVNQSSNIEIIIVDDCSTDNPVEMLK